MERETSRTRRPRRDLNRDFVAIKVDREERPDLDQVYMGAVQAMTGNGGWPMSVFLTPDGQPFYGGTYFPPEPHHGLPSFRQVLAGAARAWRDERAQVLASGRNLSETLVRQSRLPSDGDAPTEGLLIAARDELSRRFDTLNGSWGGAPKFPQPMTLDFLLGRIAGGDPAGGPMVRYTLDRMADGGIHDQLGGGFHRYATDPIWLVPHFEQMLYDNAQLARTYVRAWATLASGDRPAIDAYRLVAIHLEYALRELRRDDGTFAASQDADTDGVEGATFTWTADEVDGLLGGGEAARSSAPSTASATRATGRAGRSCRGSSRRWRRTGRSTRRGKPASRRRGRGCSPSARLDRSRSATTRRSRPGTG